MDDEEINESLSSQDNNSNEIYIPDIDTSTYVERGLNSDDIIEK